MVRSGRRGIRESALLAGVMLAIATAAGIQLARSADESAELQDRFLAYGRISVLIPGDDLNSVQARRCMADSMQAGIQVRQGTPVIISLDGRAVGGGDLSTGEHIHKMTIRGKPEPLHTSCQYKFSAPVTRPGNGQYTVDIGDAKIAFSTDELRNGITLHLS